MSVKCNYISVQHWHFFRQFCIIPLLKIFSSHISALETGNSKTFNMLSPPLRLASTNTRIALTHSSKLSGVTWAASRTMNDSVSTHLMRDLVSCWPKSWPRVKLYWLTSGWLSWVLELTGEIFSRSSFPTCQYTETTRIKKCIRI